MRKIRADIERIALSQRISPAIANASLDVQSSMFGDAIYSFEARVLTGVPREVFVRASTVQGVWDAICVYWLAPVAFWLADRTSWSWLFDVWGWCLAHEQVVIERERVNTRTCPHVEIPDDRTHIEWVTGGLT